MSEFNGTYSEDEQKQKIKRICANIGVPARVLLDEPKPFDGTYPPTPIEIVDSHPGELKEISGRANRNPIV